MIFSGYLVSMKHKTRSRIANGLGNEYISHTDIHFFVDEVFFFF